MFFKYANSHRMELVKFPVDANSQIAVPVHLAERRISIDPASKFYLEDWAVSAYEDWGLNDNGDGFEIPELKRSYKTFVGSWVCFDHQNWDESLAVGENLDAIYTPQNYVKVLMCVDKERAERRKPGIQASIQNGKITDTSMGAWCKYSACTICGNEAADPSEFCPHIRNPVRGSKVCNAETGWKEIVAGELNRGVVFFEDSIITESEGADSNAKIIAHIASKIPHFSMSNGVVSIPGDKLFFGLKNLAKQARGDNEKMLLAHFIGEISRVLDEG